MSDTLNHIDELDEMGEQLPELLPCPFCGQPGIYHHPNGGKRVIVSCRNVDCMVDCHAQHGTVEQMAQDWNTRVPAPAGERAAEESDIDEHERHLLGDDYAALTEKRGRGDEEMKKWRKNVR